MKTDGSETTPAPSDRRTAADVAVRADLATVARGGVLNLIGFVTSTLLGLLLVLIVARGFGATANGIFFESVAVFSLLVIVAQWGAETGMVRMIPRLRVLHRTADIRQAIRAGLVPVAVAGGLLGLGLYVWADPLGRLLTNAQHGDVLGSALRVLAAFIAIDAAYTVSLAATRGFGTMVPTVAIDKIGRAAAQVGLVLLVIAAGWSSTALAVAWASPMALGLVVAWICTRSLLRRWEEDRSDATAEPRRFRATFLRFWRFTAPRGLASVFAVSILWIDTLLLGAMRSAEEAGVYAAATRILAMGQFLGLALAQVVAPKMSELLSIGDRERARSVYATSTSWLILAAWPLYLTMILMAPALLAIFGPRFAEAQDAVTILGAAMLVATAVGMVDVVLLMGGRSSWNLANTVIAVASNIVLNLILIPPYGMTGAAIAWAASILINNLLPLVEVWRFVGIHPFNRGWLTAVLISLASFGVVELVVRRYIGESLPALIVACLVGVVVFVVLTAAGRRRLELSAFRDAARRSLT
jgi:O-antigen/teichoic acid export membrane protein